MDHDMGYLVLLVLAVPFAVGAGFMVAIATGVFHEPSPAEEAASNYRTSWKSARSNRCVG
jgi:hypothetical protein